MGQRVTCPDCVRSLLIAALIHAVASHSVRQGRLKQWLRRAERGLLVVWLFFVASWVNAFLFPTPPNKIDAARHQLEVIEDAVNEYQANNGRLPHCLEDLLRPDPARGGEPYFTDESALIDPWGNSYLFEIIAPQQPRLGFITPNGHLITNR
jgi:hypothetical protein